MKYLGMNKKEFLEYTKEMIRLLIKSQKEQKKILRRLGLGEHYDQ